MDFGNNQQFSKTPFWGFYYCIKYKRNVSCSYKLLLTSVIYPSLYPS